MNQLYGKHSIREFENPKCEVSTNQNAVNEIQGMVYFSASEVAAAEKNVKTILKALNENQ